MFGMGPILGVTELPAWLIMLGVIPTMGGVGAVIGSLVDPFLRRPEGKQSWRDIGFAVGGLLGILYLIFIRMREVLT